MAEKNSINSVKKCPKTESLQAISNKWPKYLSKENKNRCEQQSVCRQLHIVSK